MCYNNVSVSICPSIATAYQGAKPLLYPIWIGMQSGAVWTVTMTPHAQPHGLGHTPHSKLTQNSSPQPEAYQRKGSPIWPSTAYLGATILCIHMSWMWDAVYGALEPQPWPFNIIRMGWVAADKHMVSIGAAISMSWYAALATGAL